jgi:hypothetical protein
MVGLAFAMSDSPAPQAQWPKCRNGMVYVTSLPYRGMRRTTYACYTCRQTRSYMLPETAGEAPAADGAITAL